MGLGNLRPQRLRFGNRAGERGRGGYGLKEKERKLRGAASADSKKAEGLGRAGQGG